jgi:hypothetical protein
MRRRSPITRFAAELHVVAPMRPARVEEGLSQALKNVGRTRGSLKYQ